MRATRPRSLKTVTGAGRDTDYAIRSTIDVAERSMHLNGAPLLFDLELPAIARLSRVGSGRESAAARDGRRDAAVPDRSRCTSAVRPDSWDDSAECTEAQ